MLQGAKCLDMEDIHRGETAALGGNQQTFSSDLGPLNRRDVKPDTVKLASYLWLEKLQTLEERLLLPFT